MDALRLVEQTRAMLRHVQEAVSIVDEHGAVLATSGRLRASLGYPAGFWDGRSVFDLIRDADLPRAQVMQERVLASPGVAVVEEFLLTAADGRLEAVSVRATNLLHDPTVCGVVVVARNMERQRALVDELRAARFRAAEESIAQRCALERLTASLTTVVHDLARLAAPASERTGADDLDDLLDALAVHVRRLAGVQADLAAVISPPTPLPRSSSVDARSADTTPVGVSAAAPAAFAAESVAAASVRTSVLETLVQDVGDRNVVVEVVSAFLGALDQRLATLVDATRLGPVVVRDAVASLRASCDLLGLDLLATEAERFAGGETDLGALMASARVTRRELRRWTGEVTPSEPLLSAASAFGR